MADASNKFWSYAAGERGRNRCRAFEDARSGTLYLSWYEGGVRKSQSLGHTDRDEAKREADAFAVELGNGSPPAGHGPVTVRTLFDMYGREVTPSKGKRQQGHDRRCHNLFLRHLGPETKAENLNRRHWDSFVRDRTSGRLKPKHKREAARVGARTVTRDLKWLLAVLNWATTCRDGEGRFLLDRNPLKGLKLPNGGNPKRPVMDSNRYEAMLSKAVGISWRFRVALVLARETGRRLKSVRHLRWSDVDWQKGEVRFRAEHDKQGLEDTIPVSPQAMNALHLAREHNPGVGEAWVLPSGSPEAPASRSYLRACWLEAEKAAELEHVPGLAWHSLRRWFCTRMEAKGVPDSVICRLAGWKTRRMLDVYSQPDGEALRQAVNA